MGSRFDNQVIVLFLVVLGLSTCLILGSQFLAFDRHRIDKRFDELQELNRSFESNLDTHIQEHFELLDFLSKSSYPQVAVDFQIYDQFQGIVQKIGSDFDIFLYDKEGRLLKMTQKPRTALRPPDEIPMGTKNYLAEREGYVLYAQAFGESEVEGYLLALESKEDLAAHLKEKYLVQISNYRDFGPSIQLDWSALAGKSSGQGVDFNYKAPTDIALNIFNWYSAFALLFSLGLILLAGLSLRRSLQRPLEQLMKIIERTSISNKGLEDLELPVQDEFNRIGRALLQSHKKRMRLEKSMRDKEVSEQIARNARQVAHDIRSPLSALNLVTRDLAGVPEELKAIIVKSTQRIREVSENLHLTAKNLVGGRMNKRKESQLLRPLIDELLPELRLQTPAGIHLGFQMRSDLGLACVEVEACEFKRILSNLCHNAFEAIEETGEIQIYIRESEGQRLEVSVTDTGKGIPPEIINKVTEENFSYEKTSGTGLGLFHAQTKIQEWGGQLKIESKTNIGTNVSLCLPRSQPPQWLATRLGLKPQLHLVCIDDDESIVEMWQKILKSFVGSKGLKLHCFHKLESAEASISLLKGLKRKLFLVDYDFLSETEMDGLEFIDRHGLARESVLVTNQWEDEKLRERCLQMGVRIFPKIFLADELIAEEIALIEMASPPSEPSSDEITQA